MPGGSTPYDWPSQYFRETKFSEGQSRYAAIKALLPSPDARSAALDLPGLRGLDKYVARSDLEALCEED